MAGRDKDQLYQVDLGDKASLDVIRLDDGTVLFVLSERGPIQYRTVASVDAREAIEIAKHIVGINGNSSEEDSYAARIVWIDRHSNITGNISSFLQVTA